MSLPTTGNIQTMDYAYQGSPFVQGAAIGLVTLHTMDYAYQGSPFVANLFGGVASSATVSITELASLTDAVGTNPVTPLETPGLADSVNVTLIFPLEERFSTADFLSVSRQASAFEAPGLTDSISRTVILTITEKFAATDSVNAFDQGTPFDGTYSVKAEVSRTYQVDSSTQMGVLVYISATHSTDVSIIQNNLVPVTNASSISNPFQPTIIVNGTTLVSNLATTPTGPTDKTPVYIKIKNGGLTNASICHLSNYGFTLDYSGGGFSIDSIVKIGNKGDYVDIFGFKGTITDQGISISNSGAGYTHSGTFGNIKLNKQLNLVVYGNQAANPLLTNQTLRVPSSSKWLTVHAAANAIAGAAGISLQWAALDASLSNFQVEDGQTIIGALSSMASRVGATLRWNGNNTYLVTYPDKYFGLWEVPSCKLLAGGGIRFEEKIDLESGLSGTGNAVGYFYSPLDAGTNTLPSTSPGGGAGTAVQQIAKITKKLTSDDPPLVYDLPFDYDSVWIQILIPDGRGTGGSNLVSINNFVTTNPQQWFEFNIAGLANEYIFQTNIGGKYIPQVKVDHRLFPENDAVNDGNFVMSIAVVRKSLNAAFEKSKEAENNRIRDLLARSQDGYRFIKTYSGTIQATFFGSIPVPGMWGKATVENVKIRVPTSATTYTEYNIGDITVEGIIESVQFSYPGLITISVAQYIRLNFYSTNRTNFNTGST